MVVLKKKNIKGSDIETRKSVRWHYKREWIVLQYTRFSTHITYLEQ